MASGALLNRSRSNPTTLRDRQSLALKQMLHFGQPLTRKDQVYEPEWKVLVYDDAGKNIISPILSVKQLHEVGVTLYMALHTERDEIADTPAIYLCEPSEKNIAKIAEDLKKNMYQEYYFNFVAPLARPQLEALAEAAVNSNTTTNIRKIFDQHLSFISLEPDLFALKHLRLKKPAVGADSTFYQFNTNKMQDPQPYINAVTSGLYAVFATLGAMPIIRATNGHMAEAIAGNLDKKLRDSLRDARASMFSDSGLGFHRPLLIMLDRNVDLSAPLMHSINYQSLCHDVLDLNLNYISLQEAIGTPAEGQQQRYRTKTIDCSKDEFWNTYRTKEFFEVATKIQEKTKTWQEEMDKIKQMKSDMGLDDSVGQAVDIEGSNQVLGKAVASIPEMLAEKESLDSNMSIATSIAGLVQSRDLDKFHDREINLDTKESPLQVIKSTKGSQADKVRYLLYLILRDVIKLSEVDKYKEELQSQDCPYIGAIDYIKRLKHQTSAVQNQTDQNTPAADLAKAAGYFWNKGSAVLSNVKSMATGERSSLAITRLVDQIVGQKDTGGIEVGYWDPKMSNANTGARSKAPVEHVVVFMVGGGCYTEYLEITGQRKQARMIYGCTDLTNPENFLAELQQLGSEN